MAETSTQPTQGTKLTADRAYYLSRVIKGSEPDAKITQLYETGGTELQALDYLYSQGAGSLEDTTKFLQGLGFTSNTTKSVQAERDAIDKLYASLTNGSGGTTELKTYLQDYQKLISQPETKTAAQIKQEVAPEQAAPTPIDYVALNEKISKDLGLQGLESHFNELKGQQDDILAQRLERIQAERDKPVPAGVISGRISEIEQQEQERLDTVGRALSRVTDQLNTAYSSIDRIMKLNSMTYAEASEAYNNEWNRNMSVYGLVYQQQQDQMQYQKDALSYAQGEREFAQGEREFGFRVEQAQRQEQQYNQQIASANLQTYANLISSGGLTYNNLGDKEKLDLQRMSVQAGFPPNFLASVQMNPQDKMLFSNSETGQIVFMDQGGAVRVENIPGYKIPPKTSTGSTSKPTAAETRTKNISLYNTALSGLTGGDGYVSPDTWNDARQRWVLDDLGSYEDFEEKFNQYVNPVHAKQWVSDYNLTDKGRDILGI